MKIAHIVSTYPPYYGGMGTVVFEMASRLSLRGHEVQVFTPNYSRDAVEEDRHVIAQYARRLKPAFQYGNAAYVPQLSRELDDFDIVHLHYPFFGVGTMVARWKKRNPHKKLVITYHMDTRATGLKGLFFKWYTKVMMPTILREADRIFVSSFDYAYTSDVRDIFSKHKEKWREIPFGVDSERFYPRQKPSELFERYALDENIPTVVFVGGMDAPHFFKGVPVLLEALARVRREGIELQGVLVGEGELKEGFENLARGMGVSDVVRFVGRVDHDELPLHYAMGDICVLPSTTRGEAFGMVLLEAAASGVPVLASDLPGVRTIALEVGDVCTTGSSLDFARALSGFFEGEVERSVAKDRARRIVEEKYTWDSIIDQIDNEYRSLVA